MTDTTWTDIIEKEAGRYFSRFDSEEALQKEWASWESLSDDVNAFLSESALVELPPQAVYTQLVNLFETRPRIRGRFKALVGFQDGAKLKDALLRLVKTKEHGDPGRKIRAVGLGGLGRATASELLCLWRPYRFLPQNAVTCSALAKLTGVYRKNDVAGLPYDAFLDLAGTLEAAFRSRAAAVFPSCAERIKKRRYLYVYGFLGAIKK